MRAFSTLLKSLSDDTRLRILDVLLTHDLCVGALAHRIGISKAAASQHLQVLRKAGLVRGEKRGYWTHYAVERETLNRAADRLHQMAGKTPLTVPGCHLAASEPDSRSDFCRSVDCPAKRKFGRREE